jgi:hypothetical protein
VVKSHQRADRFRSMTYNNVILKYGFELSKVFVFVSLDEDVVKYSKEYPEINIIKAPKGIANVDNFITEYFNEGQKIIYMNDDVSGVKTLKKGKFIDTGKDQMLKIINTLFHIMSKNNITYGGFYPVLNTMFMSNADPITYDFCLIMDPFSLVINNKSIKITVGDKSDFEKSIQHFKSKGAILRYNRVGLKVEYYGTKGGFQGRDEASEIGTANEMVMKYPAYISGVKVKEKGRTSLRFKRIKAKRKIFDK